MERKRKEEAALAVIVRGDMMDGRWCVMTRTWRVKVVVKHDVGRNNVVMASIIVAMVKKDGREASLESIVVWSMEA